MAVIGIVDRSMTCLAVIGQGLGRQMMHGCLPGLLLMTEETIAEGDKAVSEGLIIPHQLMAGQTFISRTRGPGWGRGRVGDGGPHEQMMPVRNCSGVDDCGVFMTAPAVGLNKVIENAVGNAQDLIDRRRRHIGHGRNGKSEKSGRQGQRT